MTCLVLSASIQCVRSFIIHNYLMCVSNLKRPSFALCSIRISIEPLYMF